MPGSIVQTTINPAALQADGAYVSEQVISQALPANINSGLICLPGGANWGLVGIIQYFSGYDAGEAMFGDTQIAATSGGVDYGIMARASLAALGQSFAAVRVTDDTDVAATGIIADQASPASGHNIIDLLAILTGTFGDRISWRLDLVSGTTSTKPVYRFTIYPPVGNAEVFTNIIGYATTAYDGPTFSANFLAAVNGTNGTPASKWVIASAADSPSTVAPYTGTQFPLSGGVDGTEGLTDSDIVGVNGSSGGRTGMYAFSGLCGGATVMLPGVTDFTTFQALAQFCSDQVCDGVWGNWPMGTDTDTAVSDCASNNLSSQNVMLLLDWVEFNDPATATPRWLEPSAAGAGVISATPPYDYVGNKPANGIPNIIATERTITGLAIDVDEAGDRESNGINWVGNPINAGNVFGLFHGMMSDGVTYSSDLRLANVIVLNIKALLGQVVGLMQGTSVSDGTRAAARAKINEYMDTLSAYINTYEDTLDTTNNTPATIAQGTMLCSLEVQTLTPVRFAVAAVQVGAGVTISVTPVAQAA